jgi:signal transduction histidine kinase
MSSRLWAMLGFLFGVLVSFGGVVVREWSNGSSAFAAERTGEAVLTGMEDAAALQQENGTIIACNDAFQTLVGTDPEGRTVGSVLSGLPELQQRVGDGEDGVVAVEADTETRYYDVSVGTTERSGERVVTVSDVTDRHHRLEDLEARNEKLNRFASLVSHDLRNPLDVAVGRTNAVVKANEDPDLEPHLDSLQGSLERMRSIISDGLMLAKEGDDIGELEPTAIEDVGRYAWENVDTRDATVRMRTDAVVQANPNGLPHIFENLFRNAVEHVGPDVTVTVGSLSNGFYVEDDGDGIPACFEEGVPDPSDTDCGLGLAIVDILTEAHGWELDVIEGSTGGARFEFSNVTILSDEVAAQEP